MSAAASAQQTERELGELTDARLKTAMRRAIRTVAAIALAAAVVLTVVWGWRTGAMLLVGAGISVASLWEWQKLMAVISAKLDNQQAVGSARVIAGFFLRLFIAAVVLYGSLKSLHGSVYALLGGLALAAFALAIEAGRLIRY